MYAVIRTGAKQYLVREGDEILVEKLDAQADGKISLSEVLFVSKDGQHLIGKPAIKGATVSCKVLGEEKGPKLVIQKFRKRKNSRRRTGHRQQLTRLAVEKINASV